MRSTRRTAIDELIETIFANDRDDNDTALEHFIARSDTSQIFALLERFHIEYRRKINPWQFYIEYVIGKLLVEDGKLRAEDLFFIIKFSQRTKLLLSDSLIVRIVKSQPLATIDGLVKWLVEEPGKFDELLAILLHEIVIEYSRLPHVICPNLVRAARWIEQIRHPLSVLPLALLSVEAKIAPGHRSDRPGLSHTRHAPPGFRKLSFAPVQPMVDFTMCEDTTAEYQSRAQSAFLNWMKQSNGCIETRRFTSGSAVTIDNIRQVLLGLNLACLNTVTIETLVIGQTSPTDIMTVLFRCAANGGANNSGIGNPYGRLAAWQSVTELVHALPGTTFSVVNTQMQTHQWFGLGCNSPWFNHSAYDLAFVGLNPEGTRLVTIAATDTNWQPQAD